MRRQRPISAAAQERQRTTAKRAEQLSVARRNLGLCRAELAKTDLPFQTRATNERLAEHWQTWVARLSAPRVELDR